MAAPPVFADVSHGPLEIETKHHVQVAAGVGVDCKRGAPAGLGQVFDRQCSNCGLADSALAGHRNRRRHVYLVG
jgi:hypothetical protein